MFPLSVDGFALTDPLFPPSPPCHQRLHSKGDRSRGDRWLGRGGPCGVQGTIKVPPGTLPHAYSITTTLTPPQVPHIN